jgi:predicted methyltransferase
LWTVAVFALDDRDDTADESKGDSKEISMTPIQVLFACAALTVAFSGCKRAETPTAPTPPTAEPAAPAQSAAATGTADVAAIDTALANPARFAGDREQDAQRKQKDVLVFLGARPGMHVVDYFSAGGYNTELLSLIVGPEGKVIAYNNEPYRKFAGKQPDERYANNRLPNVVELTARPESASFDENSLDAALFVLSYHDLHWRAKDDSWPKTDPAAALARLVPALKTGAVVVVVDHVANPGGDPGAVADSLHRIDPALIKSDFEAAGLTFESEANFLRNPEDDHTKPVFDDAIKGKTDRVVLRFTKK